MRIFYLTGLLYFSISSVFAQKSEVGLMLGGSVYSGDISPDIINIKFIKPAGGIFYRYNFDSHWAFKGSIFYGSVMANDAESPDIFQRNRNLSFQSTIFEFSAQAEFNFFQYILGDRKHPYSPYLFTGISLFDFNPKTEYKGELVDLQPLGTEGQNLSQATKDVYSLVQLSVPLGLGLKWNVAPKICFGFEIGVRKTFTDYLDDVSGEYADKKLLATENGVKVMELSDRSLNKSLQGGRQRGNSPDSDWYTFGGITLSIAVGRTSKVSCTPFSGK